jgi:membrane fusion protein, multidrug efflux system
MMPSMPKLIFSGLLVNYKKDKLKIMSTVKHMIMKNGYSAAVLFAVLLLASACGSSQKDEKGTLNDKKAQLEKLRNEKSKTEEEIKKLQDDLRQSDTSGSSNVAKLVSVSPVMIQNFDHYIDLQAQIMADNISYISPRLGPGQVKAIYIKEGQFVKKGQLLLRLDDAVIQQSIIAEKKRLEILKGQLEYARNIYQRQKNLWDQGIGTEVQLITAKTNVTTLEDQMRAGEEGAKIYVEQMKATYVYSEVSGIADKVNIKVGETFTGAGQLGAQITIVNSNSMKIVSNIPENYFGRVRNGSPVIAEIPDANQKFNTSISLIGQSIDPAQRGFSAEARIPAGTGVKPNQLAIMRIKDYSAPNAVVIPINVVQTDEKGKYVYIMLKQGNGKMIATRRIIMTGESYGDLIEVKAGLNGGEQLITGGYQSLYEGQLISLEAK